MRNHLKIIVIVLLVSTIVPYGLLLSTKANAIDVPTITNAKTAYVYNFENDMVIFAQNTNDIIYPAGTVKIMTGILAIELLKDRYDEEITIIDSMLKKVEGYTINLKEGEIVKVIDMINMLLVSCANDAAYALAFTIADSEQAFVELMNKKAIQLGMTSTNYTNPTGLHDSKMTTTTNDIATLAKYAHSNELFNEIVAQKNYVMDATNLSEYRNRSNRNALITTQIGQTTSYEYTYVTGMNAGNTQQAGYCIVGTAEKDGLSYLCIIMGATKDDDDIYSFKNARDLFVWAFYSYKYTEILSTNDIITEIAVELSSQTDHIALSPDKSITKYLPSDINLSTDISYSYNLYSDSIKAPVKKGDELGTISVYYNDLIVGSATLIATIDAEKSNALEILSTIKAFTKSTFFIVFCIVSAVLLLSYFWLKSKHNQSTRRKTVKRIKRL